MQKFRICCAVLAVAIAMLASMVSCGSDSSTGNGPTGSIAGTITFLNTDKWPATGAIFVIVFSVYPPTGAPDAFVEIPNALGPGGTYDYKIGGLDTGTYKAVYVGWRGGVGNDKCMGLYWEFPDSVGIDPACVAQAPGPLPVTVKKNATTSGINMLADLSQAP